MGMAPLCISSFLYSYAFFYTENSKYDGTTCPRTTYSPSNQSSLYWPVVDVPDLNNVLFLSELLSSKNRSYTDWSKGYQAPNVSIRASGLQEGRATEKTVFAKYILTQGTEAISTL